MTALPRLDRGAPGQLAILGGPPVRENAMPARMAFDDAEVAELHRVIDYYRERGEDPPYSGRFEEEFCEAFVEFQGAKGFADAVTSGTAACYIALAALDLPPQSEVIISPVTDSGPLNAIIALGFTPVVADSRAGSYNTDPEQVMAVVTERTSAIMATHSAGEPLHDIDTLVTQAQARGIRVIEDCAQAPGAIWKGQRVGAFGDIAVFSTMYRKSLSTGGNGGLVYCRDLELFRLCLAHADRGKPAWRDDLDLRSPQHCLFPALNWTTNEFACAIGLSSLKRLQATVDARRSWTGELSRRLASESQACSPYAIDDGFSVFYFPIFVDVERITCSKVEFAKAVQSEGIGLGEHYGCVITSWTWAREYFSEPFATPNAEAVANRSFNLYVNERYGPAEHDDIVAAITKVERHYLKA